MFNISKITEQQEWSLNSCYNRNIDFCVWVLQVAGLQVSPFNYHNFSNQVLQQAGLDAQAWLTWLTLVVATQDNRLHWRISNIKEEVERQLSRSVELRQQYWSHLTQSIQPDEEISNFTVPTFDLQRERLQLNQYLHAQEQQYQEAAALAGSFSTDTPPASVWEGEPIVREQLELLWQEFLRIPKDTNRLKDLDVIDGFYQDLRRTSDQMVVAAEVVKRIENNPTMKQKVVNAIKEGGLAAFEKAIDNPAGAFITGAIKGWQEDEPPHPPCGGVVHYKL